MRKKFVLKRSFVIAILVSLVIIACVAIKTGYSAISHQTPMPRTARVPLLGELEIPSSPTNYKENTVDKSVKENTKHPEWENTKIYMKGDTVKFNNDIFKARWWNQGDMPSNINTESAWECMSGPEKVTVELQSKKIKQDNKFKIIGYFLEQDFLKTDPIPYEKLTHLYYGQAIPTEKSTIVPLTYPQIIPKIIAKGKENGVKVMLSVGGKKYEGKPVEKIFELATESDEKCKHLAESIINVVNQYGFDGVDIDWEYPDGESSSKYQYAKLIQYLNTGLRNKGKLLSVTISPGIAPNREILWDAKGYLDVIFDKVDWANVSTYGSEEGYLNEAFAIDAIEYWRKERKLAKEKLTIGVSFYAIPKNISYGEILAQYEDAYKKDHINDWYYNGLTTMQAKAILALQETNGITMWGMMGDTKVEEKSLLHVIWQAVENEAKKK